MNSQKDNKEEIGPSYYDTAKKVVGVAGAIVAFAGLAFLSLASSSEEKGPEEKMMKAPGGNGSIIPRNPFEENPKDFFAQQRIDRRNSKN
ncbi:hypothetical protein CARUB_v10006131mg [Capsella rubella]|uniref:Uncharacterized protein n=1 Tax=Capsella rubella TaxID=81985 RepID=R0GFY6_9BRAS|nr:hypothetical protein CARUB_v10006131mg [Capsella rubella]